MLKMPGFSCTSRASGTQGLVFIYDGTHRYLVVDLGSLRSRDVIHGPPDSPAFAEHGLVTLPKKLKSGDMDDATREDALLKCPGPCH